MSKIKISKTNCYKLREIEMFKTKVYRKGNIPLSHPHSHTLLRTLILCFRLFCYRHFYLSTPFLSIKAGLTSLTDYGGYIVFHIFSPGGIMLTAFPIIKFEYGDRMLIQYPSFVLLIAIQRKKNWYFLVLIFMSINIKKKKIALVRYLLFDIFRVSKVF